MVRYAKPELLEHLGPSHCAIEASAGTGKTYTLEHLVIQLILEGVPIVSAGAVVHGVLPVFSSRTQCQTSSSLAGSC